MAATAATAAGGIRRLRLDVTGAVQGVGFRPFLYHAAAARGLSGWIRNDGRGVMLELEGDGEALEEFLRVVRTRPPPRAVVHALHEAWLAPAGLAGLAIVRSTDGGERSAAILPDIATCAACVADIGLLHGTGEPDRRRDYAFTNCTDCGPRFSIIRDLPYDRPNTAMAAFTLCPSCRAEYENPLDRRFHAQPTACPACGPQLHLHGSAKDDGASTIEAAADCIRAGRILALKGVGGFHLLVDACDDVAVARLRQRKRRRTRPFAVMVRDLDMAREVADITDAEAELLASPAAPIVLVWHRADSRLATSVAPGNPYVGLLLPYSPLHHLLLREIGAPVVATSGNLGDEPICIDNDDAVERLAGIADVFLCHDRPIERPVDDSVVQWLAGAPALLRRSRGHAPLPIRLAAPVPPILAVGGQLKNTIALARGRDVFLSQHIGDLDSQPSRAAFERVVADFLRLYDVQPIATAHDLHPDYASTAWAASAGMGERIAVQHHHAHHAACLAEHGHSGRALGVVWDGTGLGPDGTAWGGEFLLGNAAGYRRVAHLRPFRLPGGDAAAREPRRVAVALLHVAAGDGAPALLRASGAAGAFQPAELGVLERLLDTGFRAPWTTSAGRLFDGVASLLGLRQRVDYEGEAAAALEYAAGDPGAGGYEFPLLHDGDDAPLVVDWVPAVLTLLAERQAGVPARVLAARFHAGLVNAIAAVADRVDEEAVALTGGCFQNRLLAEGAAAALRRGRHRPLLHRHVPANDGGLALGQVAVAAAMLAAR
jgi:hydrogenase maturation protein HypF